MIRAAVKAAEEGRARLEAEVAAEMEAERREREKRGGS